MISAKKILYTASILIGVLLLLSPLNTCERFDPAGELYFYNDTIIAQAMGTYVFSGAIVNIGSDEITQHGFCWSDSKGPTVESDTTTRLGQITKAGKFSSTVTGLSANTTFYVRVYVTANSRTEYSDERTFTTPAPTLPVVSTTLISNVTQDSAQSGGIVTDDGGAIITARGVCWDTISNPTIDKSHTTETGGVGEFTSSLTGLTCGMTYYVRAYATNSSGTAYGTEVNFTTHQCTANLPVVTTASISNVTDIAAQSGGNVTDDGGSSVTARGVCWSTNQNPTIADNKTRDGIGIGSFTSSILGLTPGTTYYLRAYATNDQGTGYGGEVNFSTLSSGETVTDYDGNVYTSVQIGDQLWMQENLKVTHYEDGTEIPLVEGSTEWDALGYSDKAYCWNENSTTNRDTYGGLYTWAAAMNGAASSSANPSGVQGVCPTGWHLPGDEEWTTLIDYLGGSSVAGGKLKETGFTHWGDPNAGATNETEFTALPGGNRSSSGVFGLGYSGNWWSTLESTSDRAWSRNMSYSDAAVSRNSSDKDRGISVRCVKDESSASLPTLVTTSISLITVSSAQSGGAVTSDGGAPITARGVCWSTSQNPTLTDSYTTDGTGLGTFTSSLTELDCNTTYYVRAYAINSVGTSYGSQESFTTSPCTANLPSVTTNSIGSITETSAQGGGDLTSDGGATVTARGICWSTSQSPTTSDNISTDGTGVGSFTSSITGLDCNTTYYVRAYATNSVGTAYGSQESFTTSQCSASLPSVTTNSISSITDTSAQGGGNVTLDGGATVTARGVCWSTSPAPEITDNKTTDGSGTGTFTSDITGLETNTQYYVRAYATNSVGTAYGDEVSFNTNTAIVTDYNGNSYQTILIGDQTWMAENLKATHYSDGTAIPLVENNAMWDALTEAGKAYCWNDNNSTTGDTYGALYTWAAAMNGTAGRDGGQPGAQGVCPTGWHLPTDSAWKVLEMHLGMIPLEAENTGWRGSSEGDQLKEEGTLHWNSPNAGANNNSGFTALPGGNRYDYGTFFNVGNSALFWTSTDYRTTEAWARSLSFNSSKIYRSNYQMSNGFSVRCVKDD